MDRLTRKRLNVRLRANRVRSKISGTAARPRLSVRITNRHIDAQLIDDTGSNTLVYVTTIGKKSIGTSMIERATWVGEEIASKAKSAKISSVVFDRGNHLYHGRIKALAEAARQKGLEF